MIIFDPDDLLMGETNTRCYLSPAEARAISEDIASMYGVPPPALAFEAPIPLDAHAVTIKRMARPNCLIGFEDRGVPIEMLAHELAHVVAFGYDDDAHVHDDAFGLLTCLIGWQIVQWLSENQWVDVICSPNRAPYFHAGAY